MIKTAQEIIKDAEESLVNDILDRGTSAAALYRDGKVSTANKILQKGFERVSILSNEENKVSALLTLATIYNNNRDCIKRSGLDLG